jgi:short subunit dehydrogenase-like uncharacterized protein
VIRRSATLSDGFGPEFTYHHYLQRPSLGSTLATVASAGVVLAASRVKTLRRMIADRIPSGTGPTAEDRANHWFRAKFFGEGGGQRVVTELRGGDPGYDETAKMICESALCLVENHDELPPVGGGVLTTASALGMPLVRRLEAADLALRVVRGPDPM